MLEFINKYKDFKIFDEKGRVYPLHIDRALYMDCREQSEQINDEVKNIQNAKLLEQQDEFKAFFNMINSESDLVLPSLETQKMNKKQGDENGGNLVSSGKGDKQMAPLV